MDTLNTKVAFTLGARAQYPSTVRLVCYTVVFSVVTQWGGALRDDTKNGCVAAIMALAGR